MFKMKSPHYLILLLIIIISPTIIISTETYNFFSNTSPYHNDNENDYYDGEFSKLEYDTIIQHDPINMRKIVHVGTSNGIGLLYLAIGLQLNGHGSYISSFDYQQNENQYITRTISLLPNIEIYRNEESNIQRNIVTNKILNADLLLLPCNPSLSKRIFGVESTFLYQFVNRNKYIAMKSSCFDNNNYNQILQNLGFEFVNVHYFDEEDNNQDKKQNQLQIYQRKQVIGANIMKANIGIGKFVNPANGDIIQSNEEIEMQTFTIDMNKDIFVGLSNDLFVNFTVDGFSVIDKFDIEEQHRLQKHWTVKGFTYGTHIGEFKLIYGNEKLNVPIGKAITILFDRVPVTPLPGLQSEFQSYRFGRNILQTSAIPWSKFQSKHPIHILIIGCSMKPSEINMYVQQCKLLNRNLFKFTYLSTCTSHSKHHGNTEEIVSLNKTCNGNFFTYDKVYNDEDNLSINYEQLSKIHTLSQLKSKQYKLLNKILNIFENQDMFLIQSINDHKYYHLPYLARLSKIQYRAGLLHDEVVSPPKRPFGFQSFITDSAMQCRNAEYRRRTRLPCYIINPGISIEETRHKSSSSRNSSSDLKLANNKKEHDFTIAFISQDQVASSPGIFMHVCSRLNQKYNLKCLFFTDYDDDVVNIYKNFAVNELKIDNDKRIEFLSTDLFMHKLKTEIDVTLYPNMHSSFGVEILQSIALNVSTISFGVGGSVTFLQPNVTSITLTSTNIDHIANQIIHLITNKNGLGEDIKKNAFKLIKHTFDISNYISDYEDFYLNQFLQSSSENRVKQFCMHGMTSAMYEGSSNFCLEETNRLKTNFVERKLHLRNGYDHIDL